MGSLADYKAWTQTQVSKTPGLTYNSSTARLVVNGVHPFSTYKQAEWYYDYIYKFGGNPFGVSGILPTLAVDFPSSKYYKA